MPQWWAFSATYSLRWHSSFRCKGVGLKITQWWRYRQATLTAWQCSTNMWCPKQPRCNRPDGRPRRPVLPYNITPPDGDRGFSHSPPPDSTVFWGSRQPPLWLVSKTKQANKRAALLIFKRGGQLERKKAKMEGELQGSHHLKWQCFYPNAWKPCI